MMVMNSPQENPMSTLDSLQMPWDVPECIRVLQNMFSFLVCRALWAGKPGLY